MDKTLSNKIHVVSLVCTIMVVFRHSLNMQAFGIDCMGASCVAVIENGISKLTEVAVPYFFIVSGYFFFRSSYYGKGEYVGMLHKKFHTLFVPFLIWNMVGIVPSIAAGQFVVEDAPWRYGLQLLHSDWNGVLWYVRDIMTMMVLAPLYSWFFLVDKKWLYGVVFLLLFFNWLPVDCGWVSTEGMLFFFMGGILQKCGAALDKQLPKVVLTVLCAMWLVSCFVFPRHWSIHRYNTLLGLLVVWQLCSYLPVKLSSWMLGASAYAFFIYVVHPFIIRPMKVGMAHFFHGNEMVALSIYFVLPLITVAIALLLGKKFRTHTPVVFNIVMGGRG